MVRWLRWHCPPDTGFEIRALAVWGRARYLSVTEAPHNTNFHTWMGKKQFCFFQTAETGNRTPDSGVKGSGANHYPRAPAHYYIMKHLKVRLNCLLVFLQLAHRTLRSYNNDLPGFYNNLSCVLWAREVIFWMPIATCFTFEAFMVTSMPLYESGGHIEDFMALIGN